MSADVNFHCYLCSLIMRCCTCFHSTIFADGIYFHMHHLLPCQSPNIFLLLWLLGLSLKTQELTAIFLAARLCCSLFMEGDIHTFLDFLTLVSTLWVIYMMRFKLKSTYIADLDNMPLYYVVTSFLSSFLSFGVRRITKMPSAFCLIFTSCIFRCLRKDWAS